ncbi:MAG: metallopeptidase family protein [Candidatus Omnitrophota bacterium]
MTRKDFEKDLRQALQSLPKAFREKLRNIQVVIDDKPARGKRASLLGLYEGVSLNERTGDYSMVMHDTITLFKRAIEAECKAKKLDIREEIKRTVEHEIAHHFGISDEKLKKLGLY